ncbi:MAG: protein kinase [Acidobacteriota bacterium]
MRTTPGGRVAHYEITECLGGGGMGEVFRALDSRLGRDVALKVLPKNLTSDPSLAVRFAQEARAASALNHPNIITIYDIGQQDEEPYIAMEFVAGQTLRSLLRGGPLGRRQLLEVGVQVAEGLGAAHARGIVHRDVKPENVMITGEGLVKILDFGLAKLLDPFPTHLEDTLADGARSTQPGAVLGTVGYMSPEQAQGKLADARSDVFALGCILFEMGTGRRAFEAPSPVETMAAIIQREPAIDGPGLSDDLQSIIRRCLAKDPEERYQTGRDVASSLRALMSGVAAWTPWPSPKVAAPEDVKVTPRPGLHMDSIAVVPLANSGLDTGTEYLSDGITEQLINSLSRLPSLRVIPRHTVFRYKGRDVDPLQIGRDLNVRLVLTGRVLHRGDSLNVQAELLEIPTERQIWGDQYRRKLDDIFALQEEIAQQISDKLRVRLSGEQKERLTEQQTSDPEAFRLYLKGRYFWNKRTAEGLTKAVTYFRQAVERDPGFALAYVGLADAYNNLGSYCVLAPGDAFPKARASAAQALELRPDCAEAHISLAFTQQMFAWDWESAEAEYRLGIAQNPGYATGHHWYGWFLVCRQRTDEALASMRRALEIDPLSLPISTNIGFCHFYARDYQQAIRQFEKSLEMDPEFAEAHRGLGESFEQLASLDVAITHYRRALTCASGSAEIVAPLGRALGLAGKREEARQCLKDLHELAGEHCVSGCEFAAIHLGLGEPEEALGWLEKAAEERSYRLVFMKVEPSLDPLRASPRFEALLRQVGLA